MQNTTPTVYIVDDDPAVLDSLAMLIAAQGMRTVTFPNAMEFLAHYGGNDIACLVLDIRMPQINGLALQEQLINKNVTLPIVFITGHGDIEQCRRAFQTGAIDFLTKPIDQARLIESLRKGIRLSILQHRKEEETQEVMGLLARISGREREVLELVADGMSSKEIARVLDLSPRTIEVHRANLFNKLGVDSLADLVRFYLKALEATGKKPNDDSFLNDTPTPY
ncbi:MULTISPECIES: response regulator transcription factor [Chromobacterium]|uniref:DNA-binding response regulator n=1 Tax=Chromobacterium haemolyticum TaxID=394935 RepID=A0A1W0DAB8_9NEIS|nr:MULTISPECIES: response regulator [Chromobacterium]OQS43158.1 DNA-binding response regulator [Chromobacterium haemolyticum]OQS43954.1 DNA-binding response regulator [Chromobacterium haemolyticum]QOZ84413.1 DNA-binding response regulator [Chromobacterium sp. Rain0013]WON84595.1 response regulator [Chromobacterium haemolyticum]